LEIKQAVFGIFNEEKILSRDLEEYKEYH